MKKKLILLSLCLVMISGCGTKVPKLENGQDAMVTFEELGAISAEDLYEAMKDNYALETVMNLIDKKILEDKYKDSMGEVDEYIKTHKAQLEAQYGEGDGLLKAVQQYTMYSTVEAYLDAVRLGQLQNKAVQEYAKAQIKDKEIEKYYKDEVVGDIKVNHILITADVTNEMTADEKKTAEEAAKKEIQAIIDTLKKTNKEDLESKFTELAKEKSEDETTKESGGSLGYINKGTLGTNYAELEKAAYKLKDGEFSTSVITTELGYHVIIRLDSKEKAPLDEVKDTVLETLANKYLSENSTTASVKALQEIRQEYGMEIQDTEIKTNYANFIQGQLAPKDESETQDQYY